MKNMEDPVSGRPHGVKLQIEFEMAEKDVLECD
jgi:hypothetical protein